MKLTNAEKLILVMLAEIQENLGIDGDTDTKLLSRAIYSGNEWALDWEMQGIVGDNAEPTPPDVKDVADILDMWSFLEEAIESFGPEDRDKVKKDAEPFGEHVRFTGFDGNNETRLMGIARFLVDDMGRFSRFKGRDMNSHMPSIDGYRRMLGVFSRIRPTLTHGGLTASQVASVLNARRHPDRG